MFRGVAIGGYTLRLARQRRHQWLHLVNRHRVRGVTTQHNQCTTPASPLTAKNQQRALVPPPSVLFCSALSPLSTLRPSRRKRFTRTTIQLSLSASRLEFENSGCRSPHPPPQPQHTPNPNPYSTYSNPLPSALTDLTHSISSRVSFLA